MPYVHITLLTLKQLGISNTYLLRPFLHDILKCVGDTKCRQELKDEKYPGQAIWSCHRLESVQIDGATYFQLLHLFCLHTNRLILMTRKQFFNCESERKQFRTYETWFVT